MPRTHLRRAAAVALGLVLGVVAVEVLLRAWRPDALLDATESPLPAGHHFQPGAGRFVVDAELGYRPVFGTTEYTELGTLRNEYAFEKPEGVTRVLFLGDSVTHRGQIVRALRRRLGEEGYEYWNAGVEAYGTAQEVAYFERYGLPLDPDAVVLTFHLNDFEITPQLFVDETGTMRVFTPDAPTRVDRRLFAWSYLYRLVLGLRLSAAARSSTLDGMSLEVGEALGRLRDLCAERGIDLWVLVMPILGPYDDLSEEWRAQLEPRLARIAEILDALGIRWIDLVEPHDATLAAGHPTRVAPHDPMHPGPAAADAFAEYALEEGLLEAGG